MATGRVALLLAPDHKGRAGALDTWPQPEPVCNLQVEPRRAPP